MKPFAVVLGILTGSLVAIAFGLAVVSFIFWWLQSDYPRLAEEMPLLLRSTLLFLALAALAVSGLVGVLRRRTWRLPVLCLFWVGMLAVAWYYWP